MALIACPECTRTVSSEAKACPACGFPVADRLSDGGGEAPGRIREPLMVVHPSWWGYFWYWVCFFLIVPPFIAWLKRSATVLRIYPDRITVERGLLSKCYQDFHPRDIRSVDVDQSLFARVLGIGDITISTAASAEGSEVVRSIPDPQAIRELILAQRGSR